MIPELMSKLGADVLAEAEMRPGTLFVDLGFTAPNLDTAENTFNDLNAHADGPFSLKTMMDSVYKRSLEVTQEDDATKLHLYKFSLDIDMDDGSKLARYGRIIKLNRLHFASIGYALPAILHWLEVEGYTDINYRIYTDEWKQSR
ncbi:MAG: hypothetical protein L0154_29270 [Chloroflexi bacterium]|nr:hypothetical protein [Chloroflexota bacterium]